MPLLCIGFSDTRFFLKHRGVPLRIFLVLWEKKLLTENIKVSLLSVNFFDTRFFSETQKVSPTMFFDTVRYQLFDGKLWRPVFFYPRSFSMAEFFRNIERTMYKFFRHCQTKGFQRKLVISPSFAKDVSIPEFIWNTEGFPYENFW